MVDALVSTVIQQLATILEKEIEQEVRLVVGVRDEVENLSHTFTIIQAVLRDAEKRQFMDEIVRLWLRDLKDVAYDINDVLDEWSTAILKSKIEEQRRLGVDHDHAHRTSSSGTSKKVCLGNLFSPPSCCFSLKQVGLRHDIAWRIKEINEKVDRIAKLREKFHFIHETVTSRNPEIFQKESKSKLETSSFIDASEVFDRGKDKDNIISKLLRVGSNTQQQQQLVVSTITIPVISIVGMGGLGKTTLAQLVFNDDRVEKHFDKRMWVHVGSQSFDKMKVAIDIIKQIGGIGDSVYQSGDNNNSWHYMHDKLNKSIEAKHFLLVLDDVWNEDPMEWEPLRRSLKLGSQESRIIVTTRNLEVANMMGATYVHRLDILCDEACWSLIRHYALAGREQEECDKLEKIGMELAKKCKGLPLSARTLGGLLSFKKSRQDWQNVLDNDLWAVLSSGNNTQILPSLLISYNDLPAHLKQCFAYFSHVPSGHGMSKKVTVMKWMAQGFLGDHTGASSDDLFMVGEEYFNHLVMRSFFQKDVSKSRGKWEYYKMHDLVFDFAKSLEEDACFILKIRDTIRNEELNRRTRHISLVLEGISEIPCFIYKAKGLRTLCTYGRIPKISSELFDHLTCLRTLDLSGASLEELPNEIGKLIHLRFLNLSKSIFEELPKSVTSLYNLQSLWLYDCRNLHKLPEGIGEMTNLVNLDLINSRRLSYLPKGIGRLIKLRELSNFIIGGGGDREGCKITELKDLNFLHDTLCIIGLGRVENGSDAETACLKNKQHLRALYIYFDQDHGVSQVDENVNDEEGEPEEEEVIGEGRTEIERRGGGGGGELEKVEEEVILWRRRMEDVLEGLKPHPNIEKLSISDYPCVAFPNWIASPTECINFSYMVFLELRNCRRLKQLPSTLGKLPSLETLVIRGMDQKFMGIEFFGIYDDDSVDIIVFSKLKVFQLDSMPNLEEWDVRVHQAVEDGKQKAAPVGFIFMPCLQYLHLNTLPKLRSIPQDLTQSTSLRKLLIWDCPNLTWKLPTPSLSHLPLLSLHVEELILKEDAGSLSKSLVLLFPKLKLLRVRVSPYSSLPQGLGQLTSLEILDIRTCSKIKSIIPQGEEEGVLQRLSALQELRIMRCPSLRRSCQKEIGEDWSKISHIPNIFIDDQKIK